MAMLSSASGWAQNQFLLGGGRTLPVSAATGDFSSAKPSFYVGYEHEMSETWAAICSLHFRNFYDNTEGQDLSLLTAEEGIFYLFRLTPSAYLYTGGRFSYFLPVLHPGFPIQKSTSYTSDIGISASIGIQISLTDRISFSYFLDRWRGTKTRTFQGIETVAVLGLSL
jgi:hypothetical protein